jgi:hypothetical protein
VVAAASGRRRRIHAWPRTVVVAAGLIGHGVWDLVHWRANAVVARSFSEFCWLFDVGLGVAVLVPA